MSQIEPSSGNIFSDVGVPNAEAHILKAQLVATLANIMQKRKLTQSEAAALMGLPQPKLSRILRGQFRGVSDAKLLDCLARLGTDIYISAKPVPKSARRRGRIAFVMA